MQKAVGLSLYQYQNSETKRVQGNRQSIERYLRQGYKIKESNYGNWTLVRPAKAFIEIDCGNNATYTMDMSYGIKMYYERTCISEKLANQFIDDFKKGRFEVLTDGYGFEIR